MDESNLLLNTQYNFGKGSTLEFMTIKSEDVYFYYPLFRKTDPIQTITPNIANECHLSKLPIIQNHLNEAFLNDFDFNLPVIANGFGLLKLRKMNALKNEV